MAFNLSKIIFTGRALWQCIHFYCLWYSLNQLCIIWEKNCRKIFNWSFKIGAEMHEWQAKTKTKPLGWAIKMMKILNIKFSIKISEWLCRYALKLTQSINQSLSLSLSLSLWLNGALPVKHLDTEGHSYVWEFWSQWDGNLSKYLLSLGLWLDCPEKYQVLLSEIKIVN